MDDVVAESHGYSGADIETVCKFARMIGVRELLQLAPSMSEAQRMAATPRPVSLQDVVTALCTINRSVDSDTLAKMSDFAMAFGEK